MREKTQEVYHRDNIELINQASFPSERTNLLFLWKFHSNKVKKGLVILKKWSELPFPKLVKVEPDTKKHPSRGWGRFKTFFENRS